jgi:hypothetical protein
MLTLQGRAQMTLGGVCHYPFKRQTAPKTACSSVYIMSGGMPGEDLLSSGISVTTW